MLRMLAILFGVIMIAIGVLGFLQDFAPEGLLFQTFKVNPLHNIFHLITGIVALVSGMSSRPAAKTYFIIFGLIYALIATFGFLQTPTQLLEWFAINDADNWLHSSIAVIFLYFGFFVKG